MIDKLRSLAIFATVVDCGTFRGAALHLGLAPSRVSKAVSDLEKDLGVTLLYRSTRHLSLTHEGRLLHQKARDMMSAAQSGLDGISPMSPEPQGALRVTAPAFVAQTWMMDTFADFAKAFPKVSLELNFSDQPYDLIKDGFDVAVRAGWLADSELLTRNIGQANRVLVASPGYCEGQPQPTHASDLEDWDWVRFAMRPDQMALTSPDGTVVTVTGKSHVTVNSVDSLLELVIRGVGVSVLPEHLASRGIDRGDLVRVLPDWTLQPLGLHVVWPDQSRRENLTMIFVRFLADASQ